MNKIEKSKPSVSVIIPVYNTEKYLQDCVDSLVNQTMFKDLECIFVNDRSTDNSLEILNKNKRKYKNIRVIDLEEKKCLGGARNEGIKESKGDYIYFLDSDDMIKIDTIESLYKLIKKEKYDFVSTKIYKTDNRIKFDDIYYDNYENHIYDVCDARIAASALWEKEYFIKNNLFFPELIRYEDNYLGSLIECYKPKRGTINNPKYFYRYNPNSITNSNNDRTLIVDRINLENITIAELMKRGLFTRNYDSIAYNYVNRYAITTIDLLLTRNDNVERELVLKIKNDLHYYYNNKWKKYIQYSNDKKNIIKQKLIVKILASNLYGIYITVFRILKKVYRFISKGTK